MDNKTIEFYRVVNYGKTYFYVLNKDQARHIEVITGNKTLTNRQILAFKELGFAVKEVPHPNIALGYR